MNLRVVALALLFGVPCVARATEPFAVPLPHSQTQTVQPSAALPAAPPVEDQTNALSGEWCTSDRYHASIFGMDLMIGQLMGIRPSVAVYSTERSSFVLEGFYGATLTKFGGSEAAGAGVRWVTSRGGCDSVTFGPGVDVFFNFNEEKATFIAPTVDIAWRHGFGERAALMLGVNAGVGVGLSGRDDNNGYGSVSGKVTPLISFFTGLRY